MKKLVLFAFLAITSLSFASNDEKGFVNIVDEVSLNQICVTAEAKDGDGNVLFSTNCCQTPTRVLTAAEETSLRLTLGLCADFALDLLIKNQSIN